MVACRQKSAAAIFSIEPKFEILHSGLRSRKVCKRGVQNRSNALYVFTRISGNRENAAKKLVLPAYRALGGKAGKNSKPKKSGASYFRNRRHVEGINLECGGTR